MLKKILAPTTLLLASGLMACGGGSQSSPLRPTRGYILISIDTLRADHLECYGYPRPTSPFIGSLAARGVLFENAIVQLPGTLPSHMSIFTGLYPAEHGVYPPDGVLAPDVPTIPELFQRRGFTTAGHTEGGYVHGGYGFARGFDQFSHEARRVETDVEDTFGRGLEFLRGLGDEDPFLLFLHTYSVHDPYFPSAEYVAQFWSSPPPETFEPTGPNLIAVNRGQKDLSPEGLEYFKALYDASIRHVDDVLKQFFAELERLGLSDQVTVVLTSDHGEEFMEHGKMVHEQIYPEQLRVPLIVLHPDLTPRRVASVVESIDIAPTLYEVAGIAPPTLSGESLVPLLVGGEEPVESEAYAESFARSGKTLVSADGEGLHQFLFWAVKGGGRTPWLQNEVTMDSWGSAIELEAQSFQVSRALEVTVDGSPFANVALEPDSWTKIEIPGSSAGELSRIVLAADGCVSPLSLGTAKDPRCLAFRLRGQVPPNFELFDLAADPTAQTDRALERADVVKSLVRRLRRYDREPVSDAAVRELDPELEQRLKALGYLQ